MVVETDTPKVMKWEAPDLLSHGNINLKKKKKEQITPEFQKPVKKL